MNPLTPQDDDWTWSDVGMAPPEDGQLLREQVFWQSLKEAREDPDSGDDMYPPGEAITDG